MVLLLILQLDETSSSGPRVASGDVGDGVELPVAARAAPATNRIWKRSKHKPRPKLNASIITKPGPRQKPPCFVVVRPLHLPFPSLITENQRETFFFFRLISCKLGICPSECKFLNATGPSLAMFLDCHANRWNAALSRPPTALQRRPVETFCHTQWLSSSLPC